MRTETKQFNLIWLLAMFLLLSGCSAITPLVSPHPPMIPANSDFYSIPRYTSDIDEYDAAVEGNFAPPSCPAAAGTAPGPAAKLVFCSVANGTAASPLASGVVVQVQDASGNLVGTANNTIGLTSSPAGLSGAPSVAAVNGVATFNGLTFSSAHTYALTAQAAGLASATSSSITIVAPGATAPISDLDRAKYFRNKIANNYMGDIDYVYGEYVNSLYSDKGFETFIGDSASLGLTAASTISIVARTKTILSALGTAATGVSLSLDKNFFSQQTFQALAVAMQARRQQARGTIISNLQLSVIDYPLSAVRRDLVSYFYAGTLPGALQEIQEEATTAAKNANVQVGAPSGCPATATPGATATKLAFCSLANGTLGSALSGSVVVQVQDASGHLVGTANNNVSLTASPANLNGAPVSVAAVNGVATFNTLTFSSANTYTLTAQAAGLTSATSGSITVVASGSPPPVAQPNVRTPSIDHLY